jgi:hypothetical protein
VLADALTKVLRLRRICVAGVPRFSSRRSAEAITSGGHGLISTCAITSPGEAIGLIEIFGMTGDGEDWNGPRTRRLLQRATELEPGHPER